MKDIFFFSVGFFPPGISLREFFPLEISLQDIFLSEINHTHPPQKSNGRPMKLRLRRTRAMRFTGPELDPVSVVFVK